MKKLLLALCATSLVLVPACMKKDDKGKGSKTEKHAKKAKKDKKPKNGSLMS